MPAPIPSPEEVASARRIQVWKEFIPLPLRFPLILFIIIVYMFSGGVYMSAVSEMPTHVAAGSNLANRSPSIETDRGHQRIREKSHSSS